MTAAFLGPDDRPEGPVEGRDIRLEDFSRFTPNGTRRVRLSVGESRVHGSALLRVSLAEREGFEPSVQVLARTTV